MDTLFALPSRGLVPGNIHFNFSHLGIWYLNGLHFKLTWFISVPTWLEFQGFAPKALILQARFRQCKEQRSPLFSILNKNKTIAMTTYINDTFAGDIKHDTTSGQKLYTITNTDRKIKELLLVAQESLSQISWHFLTIPIVLVWDI